jgi:hypothetical protein
MTSVGGRVKLGRKPDSCLPAATVLILRHHESDSNRIRGPQTGRRAG